MESEFSQAAHSDRIHYRASSIAAVSKAHSYRLDPFTIAAWMVVLAGIALRLELYIQNRSFWFDESLLSLNVALRSWAGLFHALAFQQTAPPLFLLIQRLCFAAFGATEQALRLAPFIAGCTVPVTAYFLARAVAGRAVTLITLSLVAFSPLAIRYSAEAKQYSFDAAAAAVLLLLTIRLLTSPHCKACWTALIVCGVFLTTASMPAMFILAAAGMALIVNQESRRHWALLGAAALAWLLTFAVIYITLYADVASGGYMQNFWRGGMISGATGVRDKLWVAFGGWFALILPFGYGPRNPLMLLYASFSILGLISLSRRSRDAAVPLLFSLPFLLVIAASSLGRWVIYERLILFAITPLAFLVASGVVTAAGYLSLRWRTPGIIVATLLLLAMPARSIVNAYLLDHRGDEDFRAACRYVRSHQKEGDLVYISSYAIYSWVWYTTHWLNPDLERVRNYLDAAFEIDEKPRLQRAGVSITKSTPVNFVFVNQGQSEILGFDTTHPSAAWADAEVNRIRDLHHSRVWILVRHNGASIVPHLDASLHRAGATRSFVQSFGFRVELLSYDFEPQAIE